MIMLIDSSMPATIGVFRADVSDQPRRNSRSDQTPPSTPPVKPHIAGIAAIMPAFRMDM
jgi:hypothetical protein